MHEKWTRGPDDRIQDATFPEGVEAGATISASSSRAGLICEARSFLEGDQFIT
jgi:hypothetical protein